MGEITIGVTFKGKINSQKMYSQGIRKGLSSNYTLTGRNLSQFGKATMTDATTPISKVAKFGKGIGHFSFGVGIVSDIAGMVTGKVSLGKGLLNTGMGIIGNWGGSVGASVGTVYFGVDNFYNGPEGSGWPGWFNGASSLQRDLDEGFNNAGPYRFHIMGAHEPK